MNNFKDFGIKPSVNNFIGDKISVVKLLNKPIKVLQYKTEPSKKKPGTDYLTLQIEINNTKRVVFTGSTVLIQQIKQVPSDKLPFTTTIIGDNDYYEFT